jgi:aspartyl-tRNA(Asn)/glutamyl-tRNA(Gln) amidotransferase subunit C
MAFSLPRRSRKDILKKPHGLTLKPIANFCLRQIASSYFATPCESTLAQKPALRIWRPAAHCLCQGRGAIASLFQPNPKGEPMSVDSATVRRIAHLARIRVSENDVPHLQNELNAILAFVEELGTVNVEGVEPMTSVMPVPMKKRADIVTDGSIPDKIVGNAPASDDHYFVVPKVVE